VSADTAPTAVDSRHPTGAGMAPQRRCRNCGAAAPDAYCAHCGQETRERLPTLREFAREAAGRYVALDGTLWRTLFALLFRPGFLTREYIAGRRRRYVRPFRLYLAASLICFLALGVTLGGAPGGAGLISLSPDPGAAPKDSGSRRPNPEGRQQDAIADDVAIALPEALKPAESLLRQRIKRFMALPPSERIAQVAGGMRRNGPYAMFVLVPAFAVMLKILYPRRRRRPLRPRLYGEHLVFAVHNHAFMFAAVTVTAFLPQPFAAAGWAWAAAYFVLSLRTVYGDGWIGAAVRALVLFLSYVPLVAIMVALVAIAAIVIG
jgi:hypothetical protein